MYAWFDRMSSVHIEFSRKYKKWIWNDYAGWSYSHSGTWFGAFGRALVNDKSRNYEL